MNYDEIKAAWNVQADEHNQWDELSEIEKVEWAFACAACLSEAAADLLESLQEIVAAADGSGWAHLDASFSKARAAITKALREQVQQAMPEVAEVEEDDSDNDCPHCDGTGEGQFDGQACIVCRGRGFL